MNLPEIVRYGVDPRCVLKKIDLFSLRTHHIHLVLAVEQALKTAPSAEGIQGLVQVGSDFLSAHSSQTCIFFHRNVISGPKSR